MFYSCIFNASSRFKLGQKDDLFWHYRYLIIRSTETPLTLTRDQLLCRIRKYGSCKQRNWARWGNLKCMRILFPTWDLHVFQAWEFPFLFGFYMFLKHGKLLPSLGSTHFSSMGIPFPALVLHVSQGGNPFPPWDLHVS